MAQWIRFSRDFAWRVPGELDGQPVILYKAGTTKFVKAEAAADAVAGGYGEEVESPRRLKEEKIAAKMAAPRPASRKRASRAVSAD